MEIEYKNINEALNFYNITDKEYKNKCYQCIENINKNNEILNKFNDIYKLLYEDKTDEYRKLWEIKNPKELFGQDYPIFGTNILLNFVFNMRECDNYNNLSEKTSLQRKIKEFLINGGKIYNGYGEINEEIIS